MYDTSCDLALSRDGVIVLDSFGAKLLEMVRTMGSLTAIAKRAGMSEGEVAGTIDSLNRSIEGQLIGLDEAGVHLTPKGDELLSTYRLREKVFQSQMENLWKKPWLTTDGVIIHNDKLVLIRRGNEPFKGKLALPGGIVEHGERVEDCVVREIKEETGLVTKVMGISGVYSDPDRDPRGHFVTIAFNLEVVGGELRAGDDAAGVGLYDIAPLPDVAADHRKIIEDALRQRKANG